MNTPGINDNSIEIFEKEGRIYIIKDGEILPYEKVDQEVLDLFMQKFRSLKAVYNEYTKDLTEENAFRKFLIHFFGPLDNVPDYDEKNQQFNTEENNNFNLSPREIEYIKYVCDDLADKQIADKMGICLNTATTYRQHVAEKMGVHTKIGIAIKALKHNII